MTTQELQWAIDLSPHTNRCIIYDLFKVVGIPGMVLLLLLTGISLVAPGTCALETDLAGDQQSGQGEAQNHF